MGGFSPSASWPSGDLKLVAAARAGSEDAFARIYDRHAAELYSYCRHMLGSRDDAEDALQQTFVNAYGAMRRSGAEISLRPWLFTIARNECLSVLRRRDSGAAEKPEPTSADLAAQVESREELKAMFADLARLPHEQRDALLLSGVQRLSGDAIAEVLGTDRERVKALVYRARRALANGREARATDCGEIREQLSVLRGGSLRRKVLRDHLLECGGCREFRLEVRRQRQLVGALLPVPLPLALKAVCLPGAAAGVGHAATVGGAGVGAGAGASAGAGGVGVGTKVVVGVSGLAAVAAAAGPVAIPGDRGDAAPARAGTGSGLLAAESESQLAAAVEPAHALDRAGTSPGAAPGGSPAGGGGPAGGPGRPSGAADAGAGNGGPVRPVAAEHDGTTATGPAGAGEASPGTAPPSTESDPPPGPGPATGAGAPSRDPSAPGPAGTPPGHGGTPPGQGGTPPGQGGVPPGQEGVPPGHGGVPPGHGGVPPGHSDAASTSAKPPSPE